MYNQHPAVAIEVLERFAVLESDEWLCFEGIQADVALALLGAHYIDGLIGTKPEHFYRNAAGRRVVHIHGYGLEPEGHDLLAALRSRV